MNAWRESVSTVKLVRVEIKVDDGEIKAVPCHFLKRTPPALIQISDSTIGSLEKIDSQSVRKVSG